MIFADEVLARRLEEVEAWCGAEWARARREIRPEADTACVEVAGGFALYLDPDAPINEVKGAGMSGPVSADDLDVMARVFHSRGIAAKVMVCPLADPSLLEGLGDRGYRAWQFEHVLYRRLDPLEVFTGPGDLDIVWAGPEEAEILNETMARGFTAPDEPGPAMLEITALSSRVEGRTGLLGRVDGKPAAAAMLLIRHGIAMLAGASTLPAYRNRGFQSAMSRARLAHAASVGCDVATIGALPGGTSQRNAERLGFRVAYTKLALVLDPPPSRDLAGGEQIPD